jgi:hypothetical protein
VTDVSKEIATMLSITGHFDGSLFCRQKPLLVGPMVGLHLNRFFRTIGVQIKAEVSWYQ